MVTVDSTVNDEIDKGDLLRANSLLETILIHRSLHSPETLLDRRCFCLLSFGHA